MALSSLEYWREREEAALESYLKDEDEYAKQINSIYDYLCDRIQKEIDSFYAKYAASEGMTMAEAKKAVSKLDIEEYGRKAAKYVADKDFSAKANAEMKLYNATMKINRLELLKSNIGLEMVSSFDELDTYMGGILTDRARAEFKRQAGILGDVVKNIDKAADTIVRGSFKNATFSDRIWMYQDMLKGSLVGLLSQGLIQGRNPKVLAKDLRELFGVQKYQAERLMRTEMARVQIEAQKQSFVAGGYEQYIFIATLDSKTCETCGEMDGKVFNVKDMETALNAPPMHPNCRCSTAAYYIRMKEVSPEEFADALHEAKSTVDPEKAWRVDEHSLEELYELKDGGAKFYVSAKGSTVAIKGDGDIISVCAKNGGDRGDSLIQFAVDNGGVKLDSYDGNHGFYVKCGFEPVSWCKWDDNGADEGWMNTEWLTVNGIKSDITTAELNKISDSALTCPREDVVFYKYTGNQTFSGIAKSKARELLAAFKGTIPASEDYDTAQAVREKEVGLS